MALSSASSDALGLSQPVRDIFQALSIAGLEVFQYSMISGRFSSPGGCSS